MRVSSLESMNATNLQSETGRALHKGLFVPVLMYGSETTVWGVGEGKI